MSKTLNARMAQKNDTAANWTSINPVLLKGEMGVESDTKKFKFGDGTSAWTALGYAGTLTSASSTNGNIKIDNVETVVYTHPSGDSNLHVPATGTSNSGKVLKAGATAGSLSWGTLTYSDVGAVASTHAGATGTAHGVATTSVAGFMSSTDKTKLDGIATGAQVNVATNLAQGTRTATTVPITSSTGTSATLAVADTDNAGVMSADMFDKLAGIEAGAQVNVATNLSLGTKTSTTIPLNSSTGADVTLPAADGTYAGLMTSAQYTKLAGIATGATANTGTVTSVGGTGTVSGLTLTGTVTTSGNLTLGGTLAVTASNFASQSANTVLIAPNGSAGVPTFRVLASADIPVLDASKITTGVFDSARLPSYVDDVIESANYAALPATGEAGKIYVCLDTNKTYRWSGSAYVYITSGAVDSVNGQTGVVSLTTTNINEGTNLYYTSARANTDFDTRIATKASTVLTDSAQICRTGDTFIIDCGSATL